MKAVQSWSWRPYTELYKPERGQRPYICQIVPGERGFRLEFIDNGAESAAHTAYVRPRGEGEWQAHPLAGEKRFSADGLCENNDYEVYIERADGARSSVRLIRTGFVPGTVINYLHPEDEEYAFSGRYLCSPSLIRLPSGRLLASMDVFAPERPQNLTLIFESADNGESWRYVTELFPCFWGKMFLSGGKLYMLSASSEYGDILIGRSDDEGRNWTVPTVLFRGSAYVRECGLHRAPMPVLIAGGRVMTDVQYGAWPRSVMCDAVMSAPEGSDLLDASNWVITPFWKPEEEKCGIENRIGGIEGSCVLAPDGAVIDFLRLGYSKWLMLAYDPKKPEEKMKFRGFSDMPATASKCDVVYDDVSGFYVTIASYDLRAEKTNRNLLSFLYSKDLEHWQLGSHLIDYRHLNPNEVGFQYVSFLIDGEDILYQCRTAFNGAHNFHDSNYATFHRLPSFRRLLV